MENKQWKEKLNNWDFWGDIKGSNSFSDVYELKEKLEDFISSLISTARQEERKEIVEKIEKMKRTSDSPCLSANGSCHGECVKYYNQAISDLLSSLQNKE